MSMRRFPVKTASTVIGIAASLALGAVPASASQPVCPGPAAPGNSRCGALVSTNGKGSPQAGISPRGYGPAQFRSAYALPETAKTAQTIAIVDAYDDPNIAADLSAYSTQFGLSQLPTCTPGQTESCFLKVNQEGSAAGPFPAVNSGWALEIALDVETAHGICPNCKVLLVEANTSSFADLGASVNTAAALGATEISNSYGGSELSSEAADTAYNQPGIAVTVSSGDNGYGSFGYPAASPYVITVGGTTLNLTSKGGYGSESVWSGSGSGCSKYVFAPEWQSFLSKTCSGKRGTADVAADADPNTGAAVYDSVKYQGRSGWFQVGGTSLSSPLVAGVYALAGGLPAKTSAAQGLYGHLKDGTLHDVTSGSDGRCSTIMCKGAAGYDGPTGVGTPHGIGAF